MEIPPLNVNIRSPIILTFKMQNYKKIDIRTKETPFLCLNAETLLFSICYEPKEYTFHFSSAIFILLAEIERKNFVFSLVLRLFICTFDFIEGTYARARKQKLCYLFCFPLAYSYLCTVAFESLLISM